MDLQEVQEALNVCQADISARFVEHKEEMKLKIKTVEADIINSIAKKVNLSDIPEMLSNKVDVNIVHQMINNTRGNLKEVEALHMMIDRIS